MEPITIAVVATILAISVGIEYLLQRGTIEEGRQLRDIANAHLLEHAPLHASEQRYVDTGRQILIRELGQTPCQALLSMDLSQRADASIHLIEALCVGYGITLSQIELIECDKNLCGSFCLGTGVLKLNVLYLASDDPAYLLEFLDTIFHELRHAVQFFALKEQVPQWEIPDAALCLWLQNIYDAIDPRKDLRGYRNQAVEVDARRMTAATLKGVC